MSSVVSQEENYTLAPFGTLSSIHKVYADPWKPNKWTTTTPQIEEPPVEDAESAQHALVVRYKISENPAKELDLHSIVVQSPYLKKALAEVLDGYPGLTLELERLEFNAPFECFVHRWEKFVAVKDEWSSDLYDEHSDEEETPAIVVSHLNMFYELLNDELASTLRTKQDLLKNGVMTPHHAWTIFEPGSLIYTKNEGHDRVYKLVSTKWDSHNKRPVLKLYCEFIDYDGVGFGKNKKTLTITGWKGTKKITKLEAFPYKFHQDIDTLEPQLIYRGRKFEAYAGFHFVAYKGIAMGKENQGDAKFDVDSRIIIDSAASMRYNTKVNIEYIETEEPSADGPQNATPGELTDDDDCVMLDKENDKSPNGKTPAVSSVAKSVLTNEQLLTCSASLRGYSLRDKKWMTFLIDNIRDITWNTDAFGSLVGPQEQKSLILAFAEAQSKNRTEFDDFIRGKGKGIIMLLSGPPGVGKTLTAESVAEAMRVPLYSIGAAELGVKPAALEKKLEDILVMCAKWNAVLLLDEADVFMECRGNHDLERNQLVAIFLRLLEYFEGIMFLTTNRLAQMDPAFESRIHLTLHYTDLDRPSRRRIWSKFLTRNDAATFSDADLDKLAKVSLNGRQIKNTLKTAQLLADRQDEVLNVDHLDTVLKLRKESERRGSGGGASGGVSGFFSGGE